MKLKSAYCTILRFVEFLETFNEKDWTFSHAKKQIYCFAFIYHSAFDSYGNIFKKYETEAFLFGFESRHLLKLSKGNTSKAMTIHGPSLTSITNHLKNAWYRYTYVSDILDDLVVCECDGAEDAHSQLRVHKQQLLTCTSNPCVWCYPWDLVQCHLCGRAS